MSSDEEYKQPRLDSDSDDDSVESFKRPQQSGPSWKTGGGGGGGGGSGFGGGSSSGGGFGGKNYYNNNNNNKGNYKKNNYNNNNSNYNNYNNRKFNNNHGSEYNHEYPTPKTNYRPDGGNAQVFDLTHKRRITIRTFADGTPSVDIREFYKTPDGDLRPGKSGICFPLSQWEKIKELMPKIDSAIEEMKEN
ncbi:transcriptional Coactivator p15-domain-containing protein [Syncephalastrum racemosum]|uniref:Transcriptional Coactivator p15-domain-containing protein n=1 Tax=Syncephalastrum racemosum TaxID=13706 RepID=A0A1X2HKU9_SYNRA|nr:transcriptional Coactivator p15-domain-containing protein [Syncephalastrum racemosum]